ncbi:RNA polymerase sigma factor [Brevibacillus laterosporus]|uniref:RNA polymerase sigma factor n=1 Tax=Brevibacillus laterosporus TaxID=1465 RepID=UPI0003B1BA42|nr:sigma-70 family RNA polymerase sigma factor [Brevibacillus laterosporus]ERM19955.1 RNA polymerase [Brevibacillus laterosporus PE36]
MDKVELENLIVEIKNGSLDKFEIIIDHFQQPIFTYCYHMLGHKQEAEDAVQDVLFRAYKNLDRYTYSLSFSAWLYKIAYNYCAKQMRRRKLNRLLPFFYNRDQEGRNYVEEEIDHHYLGEPLSSIWRRLSTEERTLLILRVLEEKDYKEIAELMNKNPATLRKQFERALKKCKYYFVKKGGMLDEGQRSI